MGLFLSASGRMNRRDWWIVQAVTFAGLAGTGVFSFSTLSSAQVGHDLKLVCLLTAMLLTILLVWTLVIATIRRLHDNGRSALWMAVNLLPVAGQVWQVWELGFVRGDAGENRYGPPPTDRFFDPMRAVLRRRQDHPCNADQTL